MASSKVPKKYPILSVSKDVRAVLQLSDSSLEPVLRA
jgi:hypothetical protein